VNETDPPADHDEPDTELVVEVPPRGCRGCVKDGSTENHRDDRGRLRPGHSSNALGRPHGPNASTKLATERLKSAADKAAKTLIAALDSKDTYAAMGAAINILKRVLPEPTSEPPADNDWMDFLTDEELETVIAIADRAKVRMLEEPLPAALPALPASTAEQEQEPASGNPVPPPEPDFEEFP
jgi:hypothetical protein